MHTEIEKLKTFRAAIYSHFSKRKDAIMNLCDAISSYGHKSRSVVGLSEAPCFERKYSSITDAIADGLPSTDWDEIEKVQFQTFFDPSERIGLWTKLSMHPGTHYKYKNEYVDKTAG